MTNLFDPPPSRELPLSKGGDLHVTLIYKPLGDSGEFAIADWPEDSTVTLVIDVKDDPIVSEAVIDGANAEIHIDHTEIDLVKARTQWRAVHTHGEIDDVLVNGTVVREDG